MAGAEDCPEPPPYFLFRRLSTLLNYLSDNLPSPTLLSIRLLMVSSAFWSRITKPP